MAHHDQHHDQPGLSTRTKWILIGFLAVGGFFLMTEHRAHLFGALPYLLILACPLMHLFHGHGGHGSHGQHQQGTNSGAANDSRFRSDTHDHGKEQS
ncbi:DUF2933 domain-containing protein [Herbaspirillum sp. HC18]|nr:DUF2933 domain-containing protein [Herbaspirillum sp. HC18]